MFLGTTITGSAFARFGSLQLAIGRRHTSLRWRATCSDRLPAASMRSCYRIEGQIGCAPDQPNPFFVHGDGREKVWRGLLMLFEAHGRQNKSSNDESYVGSEGRFSERAASQYTESPAAPISAIAFFAVFPRSSAASESPSRSHHPRSMANNTGWASCGSSL